MKVDVETLSPVEKKLLIEVPWETVKGELDLAYTGLAKRAKLKGFRPGHIPRKVLEQYYRKTVEGEVTSRLVDELFRKAVEDKDLTPINSPVVTENPSIAESAPFRFVATVEVKPEVACDNWKAIEVVRTVREVMDDEVDAELQQLREKAQVIEQITDRADAQAGDLAVVDFFGYVDGESFKGGKGINYTIDLGASQMIPGFEEQVVGIKIGEQKTFELAFPEDMGPEEVRGKSVEWKVDLKELKKKILPELDDEFAKDLGEYDTLAELKEKVKENLATREDAKSKREIRDHVVEKLVELNPVDVPPVMVERQLDYILQDAYKAIGQNKDPKLQEAIEKIRVDSHDRAKKQVAGMLLIEAVARAENVEASEADLEARLGEIARDNRIPVKQVKRQLAQDGRIDALRYNLRQDKALDLIVDAAKVTEERVQGTGAADEPVHEHAHDHGEHVHGPDCDHD